MFQSPCLVIMTKEKTLFLGHLYGKPSFSFFFQMVLSTGARKSFSPCIWGPSQSVSTLQILAGEERWLTTGPNNWAIKKIHLYQQGCSSSSVTRASWIIKNQTRPNQQTNKKKTRKKKNQPSKQKTTTKNNQKTHTANFLNWFWEIALCLSVPLPDTSLFGTLNSTVSCSWLCSPTLRASWYFWIFRQKGVNAKYYLINKRMNKFLVTGL